MRKKVSDHLWIPLWIDKWLLGSTRLECTVEERAIWIDLLALAGKDNGYIRANEEMPYHIKQLAGLLIVDEKLLENSIEKFIKLGKLEKLPNGTLYIKSWDNYKLSESYKRWIKYRNKKKNFEMNDELQTENVCEQTKKVCPQTKSDTQIKSNHNQIKSYNNIKNSSSESSDMSLKEWAEKLVLLFNSETRNLSKVYSLSKGRLDKIRVRRSEHPDIDWWKKVFFEADKVLIPGNNKHPKDWKPDFDWLIANDTNALKILEGKYPKRTDTPYWLKGAEMWLKMEEEKERNEERGQEEVVELDDKGEGRFALPDRVKT